MSKNYQPDLRYRKATESLTETESDARYALAADTYTKAEVDALFANYYTKAEINDLLGIDADFASVTLLLPFDGSDGATTTTDESNDARTITLNGDAQLDTAQQKFGTASLLLDGTGDYINANAITAIGSEDFTIEGWVRPSSVGGTQIIYDERPTSTAGVYPTIYFDPTGHINFFTDSADRINGSTIVSTGTWYHFAVTREGTNTRLFLDGVQEGSTYSDSNVYLTGASRPTLGASGSNTGAGFLNGWLDDIRVTRGVARYTAAFTPPTSAHPTS